MNFVQNFNCIFVHSPDIYQWKRSHENFSAHGNERDRLFPPAICGGFNFRAIVDYVRRDQRHTRAARLHQRRSPVPLSRARFFNPYSIIFAASTAPWFRYLRDQLLHSGALLHSVKKKKELFRRTGPDPRISITRLAHRIVPASGRTYMYTFSTDRSIFLP